MGEGGDGKGDLRAERPWNLGYGAWPRGEITEEIVRQYLERHRHRERPKDPGDFILE